jgi:hypothetical protein
MMGKETTCLPSRFLKELPANAIELPTHRGKEQSCARSMYSWLHKHNLDCQATARMHNMHAFATSRNTTIDSGENIVPVSSTNAIESTESDNNSPWPKGTRVISTRFGHGVITAVSGKGDFLTYTIRFAEGEKRIMAKFGMLTKNQ